MLAYMRVVVVWAVSPMALPSSKDCAYNLPRKALRVKHVLPSFQISPPRDTRSPDAPDASRHGAVEDQYIGTSAPTRCRPRRTLCTQSYARISLRSRRSWYILVRIELCAQS